MQDKVAYKPLNSEAARADEDDMNVDVNDDDDDGDQDEEQYLESISDQPYEDGYSYNTSYDNDINDNYYKAYKLFLPQYCANFFGLKQFRNILYTLAILLTLIFLSLITLKDSTSQQKQQQKSSLPIESLSNNHHQVEWARAAALHMQQQDQQQQQQQPPPQNYDSTIASKQQQIYSPDHSGNDNAKHNYEGTGKSHPDIETRPQYNYNYMSSIVGIRESNEIQMDDLHCPSSECSRPIAAAAATTSNNTSSSSSNDNNNNDHDVIWWTLNSRSNNQYVTVTDYIRANKSFNFNSSLTLTTQATIEFLYHTLELCKRWDGPISLAVYVPGNEFKVAITLIKFMRQCLPIPLSACIRDKLTWHLVYNRAHGPAANLLGYPKDHLDIENVPLFIEQDQCPKLAGPNPEDLIRQFEEDLRRENGLYPQNYRQQFKLTYPINVLRNTARLAAATKYILASDIELYPSINLVPSFMSYIQRHNIKQEYEYDIDRFIFTLPIFEVKPHRSAPKTKKELVELMQQGDAIFFHKWVCDACQAFPYRLDWLQMDKFVDNMSQQQQHNGDILSQHNHGEELAIFYVTQRDKKKNSWEPIYIGTNDDPLYDDRLTWDGRRDKMGQMFEMCLKNYYLLIVGNHFLVHAPGIKHIDKNDVAKRYNFMRDNNMIYDETMERLRKQYSNSSNIDKC